MSDTTLSIQVLEMLNEENLFLKAKVWELESALKRIKAIDWDTPGHHHGRQVTDVVREIHNIACEALGD